MIFLQLFLVFSYIGLFNFGGGYAMLSFIQQEIVLRHAWVSQAEFTDIVAISQMTPGPIGINCATYVGYTAVVNDAWVQSLATHYAAIPHLLGIIGSVLATVSVVWLPFIVMIAVSRFILHHRNSPILQSVFAYLRPAIIGLLAAAALGLMNAENFGHPTRQPLQFALSATIFTVVFAGVLFKRWSIIPTTLVCGLLGLLLYGILGL